MTTNHPSRLPNLAPPPLISHKLPFYPLPTCMQLLHCIAIFNEPQVAIHLHLNLYYITFVSPTGKTGYGTTKVGKLLECEFEKSTCYSLKYLMQTFQMKISLMLNFNCSFRFENNKGS